MQGLRHYALLFGILLAISVIGAGEYYCGVGINDLSKGVDVLVENCTNIGTFSIGGIYNGQWERLTYNYPIPWRGTFISIKVGEKIYSNSVQPRGEISLDEYVVQPPESDNNRITTGWRLPENLILEQRIEVLEDIARISIRLTNDNPNPISAGVRLRLDTMVGDNDGAPIYVQGEGLQSHEKEYLYPGLNFKYWEAYEREDNPDIVSTGAIQNEDLTYTSPSEVIIANWKRSMLSLWDYSADSSIPITGDSAVILYYPEENILPGETKEIVFGYGRNRDTGDVTAIPGKVSGAGFVINGIVMDEEGPYCPDDSVTIGVNLENGNLESSGTVRVEIKDDEEKTLFTERKDTGVLKPNWSGTIKFRWRAIDAGLKDFRVIATLYDSGNMETDQKTASIRIDRLSCSQTLMGINPFFLGLLLVLILIALGYIIYVKMPRGSVRLKKVKDGNTAKVIVWNNTNQVIRKCVLHDKLVKGAEVSVSTINVHRHGNSLTWNLGIMNPGEKAVLEYTIKGANVLPKAKFSWSEGEVESS